MLSLRPKCLLAKIVKRQKHRTAMSHVLFLFLWRFDPIQGHGLVLLGSAITFTGHTTIGRTPLGE